MSFSNFMDKVAGEGVGSRIRSFFGMSEMKITATKNYVRDVLQKLRKETSELEGAPLTEIVSIHESISSLIAKEEEESSEEISKLTKKLEQMAEWTKELTESTNHLQLVQGKLNNLEHK